MRKNMIRLAAVLMLLVMLPVIALAAEFAVVRGGRLNLRQYPDANSYSLGKYGTGSWVKLNNQSGNWWHVSTMDGKSGYMSASYLDTGAKQNQGTVRYANGGYVNLRTGPSLGYDVVMRVTSGSTVYIQNSSSEWYYVYVYVNGAPVYGYMHSSFISGGTTTSTVTTRNGGRVNLRSGPGSAYNSITTLATGTQVSVLLKGNNWYKISANGYTGFMSTQYLSGSGVTVNPDNGTTVSKIAYVFNPRSTQVLNLREQPSQSSRSIGQYRNGTKVKVVWKGSTWCEVYVGTRHGYMMTKYLSFNGNPQPPSDNVLYTNPPVIQPTAKPPQNYVQDIQQSTGTGGNNKLYSEESVGRLDSLIGSVDLPEAGDYVKLKVVEGSKDTRIKVYNDAAMTSLKASYKPGQEVMLLQYGKMTSMIYVDGGVAHVLSTNLDY